ncbi:MAG: efflux RND transporter periplasmic adaptor subunit [Rhizobiales bacterium]|jgi:multidrug efflux system membrane fusion protein|uniref:efflux RND transporter periplasmic adaptor subunit n=1 Tax=Agrobacterium salinitolerans TaxID=1183413 RepID=UPI00157334AC|nr:efflux RND transporter periplasmic adaptor subunit [Agrobacterium salinitolerans]MBA4775007.1 efflux RND transporter periplasmic adaptor subunit [Hyphomicrobiales bacterium]NTA39544.1 efflux RND transporter periplasmic adaptor subunit [Agrobacterium salinitolerans]
MQRGSRFWKLGALCLPIILLCSCSDSGQGEGSASEVAAPARVSVMTVKPETVTVYDELPGRVSAYRTAEIRAQVGGIIQKKLFTEGAFVKADTPLFEIDPAPFSADVDAAAAVLARTEAELLNAQVKYERAKSLSSREITSTESFNNATAALAQAKANVAEARAILARRKLELSYATLRSPIGGVIGQSFMSEGGLASASATTPLAVIQQIDQVYVDVRQSAMSLEALRDTAAEAGSQNPDELPVKIATIAGKPFAHDGKILFSDISVDSATGSLGIRILVSNPEEQLLPGMYIRAMVPRAIYSDAIRVPQEAITRDPAGRPQIVVIGQDKTGVRRTVELGPITDGQYIVTSGLAAGETVVVLGQDRVENAQPLETVPFSPAAPETKS